MVRSGNAQRCLSWIVRRGTLWDCAAPPQLDPVRRGTLWDCAAPPQLDDVRRCTLWDCAAQSQLDPIRRGTIWHCAAQLQLWTIPLVSSQLGDLLLQSGQCCAGVVCRLTRLQPQLSIASSIVTYGLLAVRDITAWRAATTAAAAATAAAATTAAAAAAATAAAAAAATGLNGMSLSDAPLPERDVMT